MELNVRRHRKKLSLLALLLLFFQENTKKVVLILVTACSFVYVGPALLPEGWLVRFPLLSRWFGMEGSPDSLKFGMDRDGQSGAASKGPGLPGDPLQSPNLFNFLKPNPLLRGVAFDTDGYAEDGEPIRFLRKKVRGILDPGTAGEFQESNPVEDMDLMGLHGTDIGALYAGSPFATRSTFQGVFKTVDPRLAFLQRTIAIDKALSSPLGGSTRRQKGGKLAAFSRKLAKASKVSSSFTAKASGSAKAVVQTGETQAAATTASPIGGDLPLADSAALLSRAVYTGESVAGRVVVTPLDGIPVGGGVVDPGTRPDVTETEACKKANAQSGPQQAALMKSIDEGRTELDGSIMTNVNNTAAAADGQAADLDQRWGDLQALAGLIDGLVSQAQAQMAIYNTRKQTLQPPLGNCDCNSQSSVNSYNARRSQIIDTLDALVAQIDGVLVPLIDDGLSGDADPDGGNEIIGRTMKFSQLAGQFGDAYGQLLSNLDSLKNQINNVAIPKIDELQQQCRDYNGLAGRIASACSCGAGGAGAPGSSGSCQGARELDCNVYDTMRQDLQNKLNNTYEPMRPRYQQRNGEVDGMASGYGSVRSQWTATLGQIQGEKPQFQNHPARNSSQCSYCGP